MEEALSKEEWKRTMDEEVKELQENGTRVFIELPLGKRQVGDKWVYTTKYKADGTLESYIALLMAKGFTQSSGINYFETFAPVAKLNAIRILVALTAKVGSEINQHDVKMLFSVER